MEVVQLQVLLQQTTTSTSSTSTNAGIPSGYQSGALNALNQYGKWT